MRIIFAIFMSIFLNQNAYAASLTINIKNIDKTEGTLKVAVFDSEDLWLNKGQSFQSYRINTDETTDSYIIEIDDLDENKMYALALHHDTNGNDKMDFKIFPPGPAEGYAFSRIGKLGLSKPKWDQCKFSVKEDTIIDITMVYP